MMKTLNDYMAMNYRMEIVEVLMLPCFVTKLLLYTVAVLLAFLSVCYRSKCGLEAAFASWYSKISLGSLPGHSARLLLCRYLTFLIWCGCGIVPYSRSCLLNLQVLYRCSS